jgi:hypothetical protein
MDSSSSGANTGLVGASGQLSVDDVNSEQLDTLSNLWINSGADKQQPTWEDDLLDRYERELDKNINENLQTEKEQSCQRLFQSFQTSACAAVQMFKEKSQQAQVSPSSWQSFQNSAGAITVLYKGKIRIANCFIYLTIYFYSYSNRI